MPLTPYHVKIKVYCASEAEAKQVQAAANSLTSETNIIGGEVLTFYSKFKQNEGILRPIIKDVLANGISAVTKHIFKLTKLR